MHGHLADGVDNIANTNTGYTHKESNKSISFHLAILNTNTIGHDSKCRSMKIKVQYMNFLKPNKYNK
jgi:hypothetical protein